VLRKRKNVRFAVAALAGVVLLAAIGSLAARQIRSPAQIAADAAAPAASRISVPVERRALATEIIVGCRSSGRWPPPVFPLMVGSKTSSPMEARSQSS
jgi:hypothetical protein